MSNAEAIVRLTEIGKRIEPDGNDYIALEMAITALWAQERQEDEPSTQPNYKTDHGYMWLCPECGLAVHSDYDRCVRCGHERREQ